MTRRAVIYSAVLSLCANYGSLFRMSSANRSSRAGKSPAVKLESATREISHHGAMSWIEVCNWRICFACLETVSGECRYAIEQAKVYFVGLSHEAFYFMPLVAFYFIPLTDFYLISMVGFYLIPLVDFYLITLADFYAIPMVGFYFIPLEESYFIPTV